MSDFGLETTAWRPSLKWYMRGWAWVVMDGVVVLALAVSGAPLIAVLALVGAYVSLVSGVRSRHRRKREYSHRASQLRVTPAMRALRAICGGSLCLSVIVAGLVLAHSLRV
jgi:hypothetical protein